MRLTMLGGLGLESGSFNRPKPLLLLAYLAVEGAKEKRHLYELFWPDAADQATSLRMALSQVRKVGTDLMTSNERTVSTNLETDLAALQNAITERNADKLVALYKGEFLQGFSLPDWSVELEEWVYSTREFITARVRAALLHIAEAEATKGKFLEAAQWAEKAYGLGKDNHEPEDLERLYPLLIAGDSALSSEVKKQAKEYGLELNLSRDEAKARYFVAVSKDSTETRNIPNNLPRAKTSFIGRDPELVEVGQLLHQLDVRLITLLGPGGMGKTRLALQLAHGQRQESHFADGIYFVALDVLEDPAQIPLVIAQTLGLNLQSKDEPSTVVKSAIGTKHMLLVFDNFEQLMGGVLLVSELLESCPNLTLLITSRERLNLEEEFVLYLQGLPLPEQGSTDLSKVEYNDAVRLFVQRAKRARLEFQLSAENLPAVLDICKLVDGSPLGIELAAVWLRSLTPPDLVREIKKSMDGLETPSHNIVGRHQSLRAVFEHSWKLLKPKEQTTLAMLTVFVGGFTREAAGQVVEATIPLLTSLVDKSLLRLSPEGRYDFHPLLHQYASEKLTERTGEKEQTRAKHGHYFLTQLEAQEPGSAAYLKCCNVEHQNLVVALAWSQEDNEAVFGLRLGYALARFWESQGYVSEGRHWMSVVLSHPGAVSPTKERAKALLYAGRIVSRQSERALAMLYGNEALTIALALGLEALAIRIYVLLTNEAQMQGDNEGGKKYAEAGLVLARKLGDDELVATTLISLGSLAEGLGKIDEAFTLFGESLTYLRKLDRQKTPEYALNVSNLGYMAWLRGDLKTAKATLEEALALAEALQNLFLTCLAQDNLSVVMLDLGDLAASEGLSRQALEYRHQQNDRWGMTFSLENFASLAAERGDAKRAALLWAVAERLREEIHSPRVASWQARQERFMTIAKGQLDASRFEAAWQEGRRMGLGEAVNCALEVNDLALT
jgi:predicted ATPase